MEINTYPRRIRRRSNLGHIFREKKCVLWSEKYGKSQSLDQFLKCSVLSDIQQTKQCHIPLFKWFYVWNTRKLKKNLEIVYYQTCFLFGFQNTREAAQTSCFVATERNLDEVSGQFFCDCQVIFLTTNKSNELN